MALDGVTTPPPPQKSEGLYDHEQPWWKRRRSWLWIAIAVAVLWASSHFLGFGFTVGTIVIILTVVGVVALWRFLGWRIGLAVLVTAIVIPLFLNLCNVWAFSDLRPRLFNHSQVAAVVTQKPEPSHKKTKVEDRKSTPTPTRVVDQPPLIKNPIGLDGPDVPVTGAKAPAAAATQVAAAPPPTPVPTPAKADPAPAKAKEEPKSAQAATPAPAKVMPPKAPGPVVAAKAPPPPAPQPVAEVTLPKAPAPAMRLARAIVRPLEVEYPCARDPSKVWRSPGQAPLAQTDDEAKAIRAAAFRCLAREAHLPNTESFVAAALAATETPGTQETLTNGMRIAYTTSRKEGRIYVGHNEVVDFDIRKVPQDRLSLVHVQETWVITYGQFRIKIGRPKICNNWDLEVVELAQPPKAEPKSLQEECVEVSYNTEEGDVVSFAVFGDEALPRSNCFGLKAAGDSEFRTPPVRCPETACDFKAMEEAVNRPRQHSGAYVAHKGLNIFSFPKIVAEHDIRRERMGYEEAFCLHRGVQHSLGVGIRSPHYLGAHPKRAIIYDSPVLIPQGLSLDYDLAWRWTF